jgi:hypothetical protein
MYQDSNNIPFFDADDLLKQWRDVCRAGNSRSFGDPEDIICEDCIDDAAEFEGAHVIGRINDYDHFLVWWSDAYYLVIENPGIAWVACRVELSQPH